MQVVLGPIADQVAGEIRASLRGAPPATSAAPPARPEAASTPSVSADFAAGEDWIRALGGEANVTDVQQRSCRLIVNLTDAAKLDQGALKRLGARAVVRSAGGRIHLLTDELTAASVLAELQPA